MSGRRSRRLFSGFGRGRGGVGISACSVRAGKMCKKHGAAAAWFGVRMDWADIGVRWLVWILT